MYIPLYFQNIQGMGPTTAGSLLLPLVIAHGCTSGLSGVVISLSGRYKPVISGGAFLWTIGAIAKIFYNQSTPTWIFLAIGIFEGIGVGCGQSVLVGLLAGTNDIDRAVVTGLRNFIRDLGGAVGTTVSGTILNNVLQNGLKARFSSELISQLTSSAFALADMDLPDDDKQLISSVYMRGLHVVFVSYALLTSLLFVSTLFLRDYGLRTKQQSYREWEEEDFAPDQDNNGQWGPR